MRELRSPAFVHVTDRRAFGTVVEGYYHGPLPLFAVSAYRDAEKKGVGWSRDLSTALQISADARWW